MNLLRKRITAEELEPYKSLTDNQVKLYAKMAAVRIQFRLVNTCIAIVLSLLIAGIYFFYQGRIVEGGSCFAVDSLFGVIGHQVYNHYFPQKGKNL